MTPDQLYDKALELWGSEAQALMLAEESCELAVAIHHLVRYGGGTELDAVAEEIADVQIMIEQLLFALPALYGDVESARRRKLERLERRIKAATGGGEG